MRNRLFDFTFKYTTLFLAGIFLLLILLLVKELIVSDSIYKINFNEIFFAIKLSLITATISSVIALVIGIPTAYYLSRYTFRFKNFIDTILDLPVVLSPIALGAMLLIFFNSKLGEYIEEHIMIFVFEVSGIILAQCFVVIGLSIRLLKNTFESIDIEYENMARTLGSSKFSAFFRVTLPLAKRGIISSLLLVWARAIGEFGATITLAGATTMKTETIPVAIFLSFESVDIRGAAIFILLLIFLSLTILFIIRKLTKN